MNAFLHTYLRRLESEFTGCNSGNRGQFNLAFFLLSTSICCGGAEKKDKSFTYSKNTQLPWKIFCLLEMQETNNESRHLENNVGIDLMIDDHSKVLPFPCFFFSIAKIFYPI